MISALRKILRSLGSFEQRLDRLQLAIGELHGALVRERTDGPLARHEFRVFSQWGEDGILDYLTRVVPLERRRFVEFGVEDYTECNTRFLLEHAGWSGLALDGSAENVRRIRDSALTWRHGLVAETAFVTAENIDAILSRHGMTGDLGILSIDVDGNDYWIWKAIRAVSPRIVVVEYNALFGAERRVTIPYRGDFARGQAHFSNLYYGASLAALTELGKEKGLALVGCNSAGNNAFFVREDLRGNLPALTAAEAYRPAGFRESRGPGGELTLLGPMEALRLLGSLPLHDLEQGRERSIAELYPA